MVALILAIAFGGLAEGAPVRCDQPAREPLGFHSRGYGLVAESFRHIHDTIAGLRDLNGASMPGGCGWSSSRSTMGPEHALAIYDIGGRFVRDFSLELLLEPADLARVPRDFCG